MPTRLVRFVVLILTLAFVVPVSSTFAGQKTVHVKGYTKKDGTTVKAHDRKAPKDKDAKAEKPPKAPKVAKTKATKATKSTRSSTIASAASTARDDNGRIQRSDAARYAFMRQSGYPNGRPGFVVDHIIPRACGGADAPSNMQWQTIEAARAKDAVERINCR